MVELNEIIQYYLQSNRRIDPTLLYNIVTRRRGSSAFIKELARQSTRNVSGIYPLFYFIFSGPESGAAMTRSEKQRKKSSLILTTTVLYR